MLIEDKFIYVSLPRRGSTSFHYSCILNGLDIKTLNYENILKNSKIDFKSINEDEIMSHIQHGHEPLTDLQKKFGFDYPVISVKRDRYETFYSLYKHVIFDLKRAGANEVYEHFKNVNLDDLFFFKTEDLLTRKTRWDVINDYLLDKKLIKVRREIIPHFTLYSEEYVINIIDILITPAIYWHNNNPNIIWFDMNNLAEMSKWVSDIIQKPFELKNVNSSKHIPCDLKLDENFIKKYNGIYDYYDLPKNEKTLI